MINFVCNITDTDTDERFDRVFVLLHYKGTLKKRSKQNLLADGIVLTEMLWNRRTDGTVIPAMI
jgi:hypothetical protein